MIFCSDCKQCQFSPFGPIRRCTSPNAQEHRNIVSGHWPECATMRKDETLCGHTGKWFEAEVKEEPKPSRWKILKEWLVNH